MTSTDSMPLAATLLGYGGLVPLVGLAILATLQPDLQPDILAAQRAYGSVILSFIGGITWGAYMQDLSYRSARMALSVIPSLAGWMALLLPPLLGAGVLVISLIAAWWQHRRYVSEGSLPVWFGKLRGHLTLVASVSLLVGHGI